MSDEFYLADWEVVSETANCFSEQQEKFDVR